MKSSSYPSLSYDTIGEGRPLLALHGWGGTRESLLPLADALADSFSTTLIDLPGFGESTMPGPEWGIEEYAETIVSFVKATLPHPLTLFGHSFGGAIALWIAAHHPSLVRSLVVCAPSWRRKQKDDSKAKSPYKKLLDRVPGVKKLFYRVFYPSSDLYRYPALEQNFRKIIHQDLTPVVGKISCPVTIIWGTGDTYVAEENGQLLHELIPQSHYKVVADARHDLPLRDPKAVAQILTSAYH